MGAIATLLALVVVLMALLGTWLYARPRTDVNQVLQKAIREYREEFGESPVPPRNLVVRRARLPPQYVGNYTYHPDTGEGVITVSHRVKDPQYYHWIVTHEVLHSLLGKDCNGLTQDECHDDRFRRLANRMGIPGKYQD